MGVTDAAKDLLISFLAGNTETAPTHMALGTDTTVPSSTDTALITENFRATLTETTITGQEVQFTFRLSTAQGNSVAFTEAGLFNASTSGDMFARNTFIAVNKTNSFELEVRITLKIQ
jgi:hypothetical protein